MNISDNHRLVLEVRNRKLEPLPIISDDITIACLPPPLAVRCGVLWCSVVCPHTTLTGEESHGNDNLFVDRFHQQMSRPAESSKSGLL